VVMSASAKKKKDGSKMIGFGELTELVYLLRDQNLEYKAKLDMLNSKTKTLEAIVTIQKQQITDLRCSLANTILRSGTTLYNVTRFQAHKAAVTCMCWWQSVLFTGSSDKTIRAWQDNVAGDYTLVYTLRGHIGAISSVISLGQFIASSSADCKVKVWDPKDPSFACVATLEKHSASCNALVYHQKMKHLASGGSDGYIYVYAPQKAFDMDFKVNTEAGGIFALSPFGCNYVASGHNCGTVKIWDATSDWLCTRTLKAAHINSVTALVEWRGFLITADKLSLKVWESREWSVVGEAFGHGKSVTSLVVSPETGDYPFNTIGMVLSSTIEGFIYFWDIRTIMFHYECAHGKQLKMKFFYKMSVENSDETKAIGERSSIIEKEKFDLTPITALLFSLNGQTLVTGDRKARIKTWGGFAAMYTSIPLEEIKEKEDEIKMLSAKK